jgi:hypothetical protein
MTSGGTEKFPGYLCSPPPSKEKVYEPFGMLLPGSLRKVWNLKGHFSENALILDL